MDHSFALSHGQTFPLYICEDFCVEGEIKPTGEFFLHTPWIARWSKDVYLHGLQVLKEILDLARTYNHERIYIFIPNDPKLYKFETMFGFETIEIFTDQKDYFILMARDTSWV